MTNSRSRHAYPYRVFQNGVGLIEVMIALFILAFGALAIGNVQISALTSVSVSTSHFSVSKLTEEIAEQLKADPVEAGLGGYNTPFADTAARTSIPAQRAGVINNWKNNVSTALPSGATQINCTTNVCTISLRWSERITSGATEQLYNLRIPLQTD